MEPTAARTADEGLVRGLGAGDAALVTIGSVLGTAVFITTADVARLLPHPGLIVAVWALGGALTLAGWTWSVNGGQLGGALAIAFLTVVNYLGLREGAGVQNVVTVVKIGSIVGFALFGLMVAAPVVPHLAAPLPPSVTGSALGVAMIAVLWGYD